MFDTTPPASARHFPVLRAEDLMVSLGANMGDCLSCSEELVLDDIYEMTGGAGLTQLAVIPRTAATFRIAPDSKTGAPGAMLYLDAALTFMSSQGSLIEAFLFVETDTTDEITAIYLLPLTALAPQMDYQLVGLDNAGAALRFAQTACVSFTAGTRITLATGAQRPVEDLRPGDRVLTRDDGVQPIRWIGRSTQRATGELAPVRIAAGALNNDRDLLLSPGHGLFVYQRSDRLGAGRAEVLVRARHLVNDTSVTRAEGGFVDYVQLLFDSHQIIYAEGIAAESMLIDVQTTALLPPSPMTSLGPDSPGHLTRPLRGWEIDARLASRPDAARLLRRASTS